MNAEIQRLVAACKTISEVYLVRLAAKGDEAGLLKYSLRLADYSTRIAAALGPTFTKAEVAELEPAPVVEAPPNYGDRQEMSSALYGDWFTKWFMGRFPEAYRDYPPVVHAVAPGAIASAATEDGCLAQATAAGIFGPPDGINAGLGDFSLYTALTSTDDVHKVWHMGKLVGTQAGGDGLEYAHSLGFNW